MNKKQLQYYLKELNYLHQEGQTFAAQYPQVANKLGIHINEFRDPHLAKLVQSVAFLTGRIAQKIDTQFDYINQNILQILSPHLIYTTPGCTILQFKCQPKNAGQMLAKGTLVYQQNADPDAGQIAQNVYMQTVYPVQLTAAQVTGMRFVDGYMYKLSCKTVLELDMQQIDQKRIRLYINTHYLDAMTLYKLLFDTMDNTVYLSKNGKLVYTKFKLEKVGFGENDQLYTCHKHEDNRFVHMYEFVAYYKKFMFVDLVLEDEDIQFNNGEKNTFVLPLSDNESAQTIILHKNMFLTNCTPGINLFSGYANPITIQHENSFEKLSPMHNTLNIHSIMKISTSIKYYVQSQMQKQEYANYLDGSNNHNTWIMFKDEQNFMIGLNAEENMDAIDYEILMPYVLYYNQKINAPINSEWMMENIISGVKCINIDTVTKPKYGLDSCEYTAAIHALHTNYLGQFSFSQTSSILNRLMHLYKHLNTDHVNMDSYIDNISLKNTVTYQIIDNILTPVPCFSYRIETDAKYGAKAYVFGLVFAETLKANELMNTVVKYTIA